MAGLPHNQGRDCPPSATQHGGTFPAQPLVLGPLMGALREQKADIMDAMDLLHSNIDHPGQDWETHIPFVQSTLRK